MYKRDGDQETAVGCKNAKYHRYFLTMCPTYAFIDRADGKFNRAMGFKKDYAALLSSAWDIDTAYSQYLMDPEAEAYDVMKSMGLGYFGSGDDYKKSAHVIATLSDSDVKDSIFKAQFADPFGWDKEKDNK